MSSQKSAISQGATANESLQLKVGVELHQQLATKTKLFCACPASSNSDAISSEDVEQRFPVQFTRVLRAATSELGETDLATKFEARREISVRYLSNRQTSCLVEADEEPPHSLNREALDTALIFALSLKSKVIDEIHVMRKIVVDGSNTCGFQRTAVVALGGTLQYGSEANPKKVAVQSITLEEDAARAVKLPNTQAGEKGYALDRLGIPLVEVALAPIEGGAEEVQEAAASLGRLMRSSGRIARGLGTIRQDLNISIMNSSNIIEVKGVQRLEQISKVIQFEAARQKFFFDLSREIKLATEGMLEINVENATELFRNSSSNVIKRAFSANGAKARVCCITIKHFAGFIGKENSFGSRLGKELGAISKAYGLGGVFHSDELPNYGITSVDISGLRKTFALSENEAFVLLAGSEERVHACALALVERLQTALNGVSAETRAASEDGETLFLRPRPGAGRMYPETDIPLIEISKEYLKKLETLVPEPWEVQVKAFAQKYRLPHQLAQQLSDSDRKEVFEEVLARAKNLSAGFVASSLVDTLQNLSREGAETGNLSNIQLEQALLALDQGTFAKEALPDILRYLASNPEVTLEQALTKAGLGTISREELVSVVQGIVQSNLEFVKAKGQGAAQSTIMGKVMQKVRGKADGKLVNEIVSSELRKALSK